MSHLSRRDALRYGAAAAAVATGVAGARALSISGSSGQALAAPAGNRDPRDFELQYHGKRIRGVHGGTVAGPAGVASRQRRKPHEVFIDGRKLAVMEIELPAAGGGLTIGYISAINHYEPVLIDAERNKGGLLKLAKRAVDVLGDTELTAVAGEHHDHGR
ncbi:tyrosinase family oxidase copper chaperone [Actinoplanes aureus]|uniref:Tyrosinase co-factor MelC1 n=1 Tax=Actinoplanes aureus TaxID=2792083 RepID=A0A931CEG7_9ACTN|nr:tyrosinase family oxidase copper chaperone [Actinoplanes aureus]MBG0568629.1 hypothetical protein [Actinoplanes aureus]